MRRESAALAALILLNGCAATFRPIPPLPEIGDSAITLDRAFEQLSEARHELDRRIDEIAGTKATLNIATFAGAMTAVGFGMFKGSTDQIKIATLSTGGFIIADRLFASTDPLQVYLDGVSALVCIEQASAPVRGAIGKLAGPTRRLAEAKRDLASAIQAAEGQLDALTSGKGAAYQGAKDEIRAETISPAKDTLATAGTKLNFAQGVLDDTSPLGSAMSARIVGVMDLVRKRIAGKLVTASDVANVVRGLDQLGLANLSNVNPVPSRQPPLGGGAPGGKLGAPSQQNVAATKKEILADEAFRDLDRKLQVAKSAAAAVPDEITNNVPQSTAAVTACQVSETAIAPLEKRPTGDITLKKGTKFSYWILGGRPPYQQRVIGQPSTTIVVQELSDRTGGFTVEATGSAEAGEKVLVEVVDSSHTPPTTHSFKIVVEK